VLDQLGEADWELPSGCVGWTVKDLVARVTSNQKEMVEPTPPPAEPIDHLNRPPGIGVVHG
jgi:hypothetical protein